MQFDQTTQNNLSGILNWKNKIKLKKGSDYAEYIDQKQKITAGKNHVQQQDVREIKCQA